MIFFVFPILCNRGKNHYQEINFLSYLLLHHIIAVLTNEFQVKLSQGTVHNCPASSTA